MLGFIKDKKKKFYFTSYFAPFLHVCMFLKVLYNSH